MITNRRLGIHLNALVQRGADFLFGKYLCTYVFIDGMAYRGNIRQALPRQKYISHIATVTWGKLSCLVLRESPESLGGVKCIKMVEQGDLVV